MMLLRSACCTVAMLPVLWLGGCADSLPEAKPIKRFTDLIRGYDSTLTKSEREAVITELQKEKERQQEQIEQGDGGLKTNE